jgi:IMP dehydrogenase/GMP reductase
MTKIIDDIALDFNDVLIKPRPSALSSRKDVDLNVQYKTLSGQTISGIPIISANMSAVSTFDMAKALASHGLFCALHKHYTALEYMQFFRDNANIADKVFLTIGMKDFYILEDMAKFNRVPKLIACDVANGYMYEFASYIEKVRKIAPNSIIMAGNVVCGEGASMLLAAGADIIKVGIGSGCFAAGTRVLMENGSYKNIEDIKLHDKVINQRGEAVEVIGTTFSGLKKVKKYRNNIFPGYSYATGDHKHWVGDLSTSKDFAQSVSIVKFLDKATKNNESKFKWKTLNEYNNDYVCLMPKNINFNLPDKFNYDITKFIFNKVASSHLYTNLTPSYGLGFLIGSFLGDGNARIYTSYRNKGGNHRKNTTGSLLWYFGKNEQVLADLVKKFLKEIFNAECKFEYTNNMIKVHCRNNPLVRFFHQFGKGTDKHLIDELRCSDNSYLTGMYDGLLGSDGHYASDGRESLSNTSPKIIELFLFLGKMVNGYYPSIQTKPPKIGGFGGNIENYKTSFLARSVNHPEWLFTNNYQINRINEFEDYDLYVPTYDIQVDCDTHSFIANNMIVHNSVCHTRLVAGVGVPQLSAILDTIEEVYNKGGLLCSDGGIVNAGDFSKAFVAGANFVMAGGIFSGHDECNMTKFTDEHGRTFMEYYGMSSEHAMNKHNGGMNSYRASEGKLVRVPYKGSVHATIEHILGGIRSTGTYIGAQNLNMFSYYGKLRRVRATHNKVYGE